MQLSKAEVSQLLESDNTNEQLGILLSERQPDTVTNHFSRGRGWPEDEYYEVSSVEVDEGLIRAECSVEFKEVETSGCPEMPRKHERGGSFVTTVDANGNVDFEFREETWVV